MREAVVRPVTPAPMTMMGEGGIVALRKEAVVDFS
jgi:hypothetical protein